MSRPRWIVPALLISLALLAELQLISATHFRYGTISWCKTATPNEVKFEVNLVYKRDYNWGQWYSEMWSSDGVNFNAKIASTGGYQNFPNDGTDYVNGATPWMLRFPTGWGTYGVPLTAPGFPNRLQCEDPLLYAGIGPTKNASLPCTPWSETVGWFYGDGTYDTLILSLVEINFEPTAIGNYVRGKSSFSHLYPSTAPTTGLWTAYFTGGNRLSTLRNNHDGRYRLESTVNLESINCSPIATGLPVLPVPYVGRAYNSTYGFMSTFQIAAYDPDVRPGQVGDSDKVFFRVGTQREFGYLLEHSADNSNDAQWTEAQWNAKVQMLQKADTDAGRPARTTLVGSRGEVHGVQWDNAIDYAHAPDDLVIDANTGIVTWETGISFFKDDMDAYPNGTAAPNPPKPRKQSGFYNLVIMISSSAHSTRFPNLMVTIPLDFLMYLYPPMYYCAFGCARGTGANLVTFRTSDGRYGDAGTEAPADWIYNATVAPGGLAPGTGKCFLCGGGEINSTVYNPRSYCTPTLPGGQECAGACPGVRTSSEGFVNNTDDCVTASPYQRGNTPPITIVPAKSACKLNTAPYWVFGPSDTPAVDMTDTYPIKRSVVRVLKGTDAIFNLVARDDDDCVELRIYKLGFYTLANSVMELKQPTRDVLANGVVGKQVRTRFEWRVNPGAPDDRPVELTICFYAFDNYLLSKFLCVRIQIYQNSPPPPSPPPPSPPPPVPMDLLWCDEGPGGFGLDMYSVTGATYEAYLGEETCIPLCIRNPSRLRNHTWPLGILSVTLPGNGSLPFTPFDFPYDETNFPINGTFNGTLHTNPLRQSYCFAPTVTEECVYTVCFQGFDFTNAQSPDRTSIRCYKIEVKNDVLFFPSSQFSGLAAPALGDSISPKQGLSFSAWVNPSCDLQDVNSTILYFNGSDYDVRNGLRWVKDMEGGSFAYYDDYAGVARSPAIYDCDMWHYVAVTITKKNRGYLVVDHVERTRRLPRTSQWYKYSVTEFSTPSRPDDFTGLVLGYKEGEPFYGLIDEVRVWGRNLSLSEIKTGLYERQLSAGFEDELVGYYTMRPDPIEPVPWYLVTPSYWSQRYYRLEPFTGNVSDWSLSGMHPLLPVGAPLNATVQLPITQAGAIPPMIPCVLGMEFPTGPCDGSCKTSVYGWSIAKGQALKCKFGDTEVAGDWMSENEASCSTPPHFLPAYVPVLLSNDGVNFTKPEWVQKKVSHLYLGGGGRGCQALGDEDRITCGLRATTPSGRARGRFCNHEAGEAAETFRRK